MLKPSAILPRGVGELTRYMLVVLAGWILCTPGAWAEDEELRSLEVYNGSRSEMVSVSRSPRPASQTAENITVITAPEIEALNAHTLADVLAGVPGIQLEMTRTPGTAVNIEIQGSNFNHVLVLIDDIPLNNLADNYPDIAMIPVQMIERVEIVKGAASTTWGNALGGVVNVITKSPAERPFTGMLAGSLGESLTADTRGEASGTLGNFGYYLTGGVLRSNGLLENNGANKYSLYKKLRYELPTHGTITFSTLFSAGASGTVAFPPADAKQNQDGHEVFSSLLFACPLSERLLFEAAARFRHSDETLTTTYISTGQPRQINHDLEYTVGGSLKLSWLSELQRVVVGVDYDHQRIHVKDPLEDVPGNQLKRTGERVGIYLNDTLTLGDFAITPSGRYDHTGTNENLFSPSLGITYALTENTVLRGYTTRGYSLTSFNRPNSTEKVWTSQVGVESGEIPYLWLKGTLFRNDTWNIGVRNSAVPLRQLKQGAEVEARTLPVWNTSLSLGYTFIHGTDGETGAVVSGVPRHTVDLGVKFQDRSGLRALFAGRYIDWNDEGGKYNSMIWDLHLSKTFRLTESRSVEVFGSLWNLFNGSQYPAGPFFNTKRWGELGVRCNF